MTYQNENDLIQHLLEGNEKAYRYIVESYQHNMLYVARAIVGTAIADEVVQEAWVSVIKALPKFEGRSNLKTWILRIVSNSAKTRLRKESRSTSVGNASDLEALHIPSERFKENGHWAASPQKWNIATPDELISSEELKNIIYATIETLPPVQQSIISLRDMEGMPMADICKILDITESNSRVLLHRARAKIWQEVDKYQENQNVKL